MDTPRTIAVDLERAFFSVINLIHEIGEEHAGIVNTFGRTLAQSIIAGVNVPAHTTASKDGYAARVEDTAGATEKDPLSLSILAEASSGIKNLEPGTVVRVKAGNPLPHGADTVIDAARAFRPDDGPQVLVMAESKLMENIHLAGSVISERQLVLERGTLIMGFEMGLLASLGLHGVAIRRKPKVAIITTGASTVDILEKLEIGKARNNVRYSLVGMILESGCDIGRLIHIKEGRIALEKAIAGCLNCDAVIVAIGHEDKHDAAIAALRNVCTVHFDRVHMEPGAASAFGTDNGKPIFIAPAKAIAEAFEALIRPGLLKLLGRATFTRPKHRAILQTALKLNPGYSHFIKAHTSSDGTDYTAKPMGTHPPHSQLHAHPNSLIIVPQNIESLKRGDDVDIMVFC